MEIGDQCEWHFPWLVIDLPLIIILSTGISQMKPSFWKIRHDNKQNVWFTFTLERFWDTCNVVFSLYTMHLFYWFMVSPVSTAVLNTFSWHLNKVVIIIIIIIVTIINRTILNQSEFQANTIMLLTWSVGKCLQANHNWFWCCFSLFENMVQVF